MKTVVIALGGNALLDPSGKQSLSKENKNIDMVTREIALICKNSSDRIIITHGNGSQIGEELMRNEHAKKYVQKLPLRLLNAETQAVLGSIIETSLLNNLKTVGSKKDVCVVLTHVLVDEKDPAFRKPLKQIGPFYSKRELEEELKLDRFEYIRYESKYRKVVASPKPNRILELDTIRREADKNIIVSCGGGGLPVINKGNRLVSVDAVIDKDLTSQLLATSIGADMLIILTNADYIYRDYKKLKGPIKKITAKELRVMAGSLEAGTMRPKVEACIEFIENGGKAAYIGNVFKLSLILNGRSGTKIV
jgi:carbamate kinase